MDGRAPFSRIAAVLDISDRTAARRFARLRAHGLLRVTAVPDSRRLGQAEWLVRLRVHPDSARSLARGLANRPDTSWVTVLSGGAEVNAIFRVPGEQTPPLETIAPMWMTLAAVMPTRAGSGSLAANNVLCVCITPFGSPVVPEVKITNVMSLGSGR
ncbi:hypothetical protein ACIRRA_22260 [Nocardia sp. NPDC101769]|uniref:hypothetical protein n=1 Tax=Nocardia sp. NPDC101769 TaxID=3364333 RepID=UPI0038237C5D